MYLDEINFTKSALLKREYSFMNTSLTVNQEEVFVGYRSVIASITEEEGICLCTIYPEAIVAEDFIQYLKKLRSKFKKVPLTLFMDNLQVHRATTVKPWWEKLEITPLWNVSYSPEFNGIEAVFSKVKRSFCRERLNCLVNKIGFNVER